MDERSDRSLIIQSSGSVLWTAAEGYTGVLVCRHPVVRPSEIETRTDILIESLFPNSFESVFSNKIRGDSNLVYKVRNYLLFPSCFVSNCVTVFSPELHTITTVLYFPTLRFVINKSNSCFPNLVTYLTQSTNILSGNRTDFRRFHFNGYTLKVSIGRS